MIEKTFNVSILFILLLVSLDIPVYGTVNNAYHCQANFVSAESPKVILKEGIVGNSTIFTNSTSAKVEIKVVERHWKVQSGTGVINSGSSYTLIDVEPINLSKSFLLVSFGGGVASTQPEEQVLVSGKFESSSQLRFERVGTTNPANFAWYVIEALGEQISVQSGTTQFASTETQKDVPINDVGNIAKCVVFLSRRSTGTDASQYNKAFVTGVLTSATNLRLRREGTGTTVTVEWFVVKFNDETVIQTGETVVSTSNPTIQSIAPVDITRTWLYMTWRATTNGLAQVSVRGWIENSAEIRFFRRTTTGTCYVRWYVIQMPAGVKVQRGFHDSTTNTELVKNIQILSVNTSKAFSFTTCDSTGTGRAFPRPFWTETLTNSTNLRLQRWYAGQESDHNWQVIELSDAYEYILKIVSQSSDPWKIRLEAYNQTNIERLYNCTIYFYNTTTVSRQIYIFDGEYNQKIGQWYGLLGTSTVYIAMKVSIKNPGKSYIYTNLKILHPNTSTYNLMVITFKIS
ncbi:MAG: hypothetical protein QXU21_07230 [Candidatus Bathyarchaeia archaeon]